MIIWFLMIIPLVSVIFLLLKYPKEVTLLEVISMFGIALVLICAAKIFGEKALIYDTEYWGNLVIEAEYYEEWNEYISQTCSTTDSKGNITTYDCSYVDFHPEEWIVKLDDGRKINITKKVYDDILAKFKQKKFVNLHRSYHSIDGDMYTSKWDGSKETYHFIATEHLYDNYVQASKSVFNFPNVPIEERSRYSLHRYPYIENFDVQTILGNWQNSKDLEKELKWLIGKYGNSKQIRLWILMFENKSIKSAQMQEWFWKGGNKNEFVICIGHDKGSIQWVYPFSWTESQKMKIETRDYIMQSKHLDSLDLAPFLEQQIQKNWKRKEFKDFNYLTTEPPLSAIIIAFCLQIIYNILYGIWIVKNKYTN